MVLLKRPAGGSFARAATSRSYARNPTVLRLFDITGTAATFTVVDTREASVWRRPRGEGE